eukprot:superscaffoldBa00000979_g8335
MKNKGTKQKSKKKGSENAFGCDLIEHLQNSGQDVPQVLKKCAEFIEEHGIVDGIYRLSGVTSNIQRLRQEFSSEACPDLTKEVYLQDIHCVGSLCKLYFRELPNPLLTYELYSKFTEAASVRGDHERLVHIQKVIKELPTPHFKTLEYLTKHLAHLATLSTQTNMHTRNLALVWAPNLLRSKDIEASSGNGDMAFQEVRIQQSVVEFILNNTEQIFSDDSVEIKPKEGPTLMCGEKKYATLPISGQCGPMKLMSLEEAQARSLSPNHPVHRERQRENSLPDTSTATLYHTVIDISDSKRKFSGKSKKWKSIFNLGRSVDSKGKLSRNGSVFIRAQGITEKAALRPSRSMESLCSLPTDDDRTGNNSPTGGPGSIYVPDVKSRTLGSDSLYDLNEHDQNWEFKGKKADGATGGWSSSMNQKGSPGASSPPQKTLPEQLKVFKGDDGSGYKPTSPKNRRMLYSGSSHNSSSRPSFPGSFFPLESSPRHQRRAVNISEPFAVSVPLRVSAVISSNSTPCRGHAKEKAAAAALKPCKETAEQSSNSGKSNTFPQLEPKKQEGTEKKNMEEPASRVPPEDTSKEVVQEGQEGINNSELEQPSIANAREGKDAAPSPGKELHNQPTAKQQDMGSSIGKELWSDLNQELKITEPEIDLLDETFKPVSSSKNTCENMKLTMDVKSKRSRSSPSLTLLCRDLSSNTSLSDHFIATGSASAKKQPSESDIPFSLHKNFDAVVGGNTENVCPAAMLDKKNKKLHQISPNITSLKKDDPAYSQLPFKETCLTQVKSHLTLEDAPTVRGFSAADDPNKKSEKHEIPEGDKNVSCGGVKKTVIPELELIQRLSVCLEERRRTLELPNLDDDEGGCGATSEELDLVEPWEDLSSTKQWVTSPLHSPDVEELFKQLSPFGCVAEPLSSEEGKTRLYAEIQPQVSVSSVRTAFMIKTCQAKAVPVVPPKVQYSQIPHSRHENDVDAAKEQEKEYPKMVAEKSNSAPPPMMSDLKEELENKEPAPKHQRHPHVEKSAESARTTSTPELPVITRRHAPSLEVFVDCPRPNRTNIMQRPSFRNRQRPQSLILLSPPFPIMDYPPSGDDGKLLSSIRSMNDTSAVNAFSKEMAENFKTPEGIALQNKMTIPKSGQRLETSTSCFYQPQRRSMIFDSRSHRQIE